MGKRGPKPAADGPKTATISARISLGTRDRLEASAKANGRTLSAELEAQLVRGLDIEQTPAFTLFGGETTYAFMRFAAAASKSITDRTGEYWYKTPFGHSIMTEIFSILMQRSKPDGECLPPDDFPLLGNTMVALKNMEIDGNIYPMAVNVEWDEESLKAERERWRSMNARQIAREFINNGFNFLNFSPHTDADSLNSFRNMANKLQPLFSRSGNKEEKKP